MMASTPRWSGSHTGVWRHTTLARVGFDGRQHFTARSPIVLGKIDFDPRVAARADGVQRTRQCEGREPPRQPFTQAAGGDDRGHLIDKPRGALSAELGDADVFAVSLRLAQPVVDGSDETVTDGDLHLHVAVLRSTGAGAEEQRVLVAARQEIAKQLRMEQHIAVEDNETATEQIAGQPQRVEAVGGGKSTVVDDLDAAAARLPDRVGAVAGDDHQPLDAAGPKLTDLTFDQRAISGCPEALRPIAEDRAQSAAATGGEDDGDHAPSESGIGRHLAVSSLILWK